MTETKGKKALSLCILRVLEQHASEKEPLSTRRIIEYLKEDFGMIAERKAVGRNLILLTEMGFGLSTYHENGKGYFLTSAADPMAFDPVLYDALLRAPLTEEGERRIRSMQPDVPIYAVRETPHTLPVAVFEVLEALRKAIREKRQVTFLYHTAHAQSAFSAAPDATYVISPYALFLAEDRYAVIASVSGYGRLLHFRCDYMQNLTVLDAPARDADELPECRDGIDVIGYVNRAIYRQDTAETYTLLCAGTLAPILADAFGQAATLEPEGDNLCVTVRAPWSSVRRFVLQNLTQVTLRLPESRRRQLRDELSGALSIYPQS